MVFGLLWTLIVVIIAIILIVILLKLVFAIIAIGPVAIEQQDVQTMALFAKTPQIFGIVSS
jgi:hypothetical protein